MITDLGKFLDPLADKLLVLSSVIMFVHFGRIAAWAAIIIIGRELIITIFRGASRRSTGV
jgi:CDP-diacylglycerol--glycerol-3-phosphate 3-phosphatidyltransferase